MTSADILKELISAGTSVVLDDFELDELELFASVILAQNTKWSNAKKALDNLKSAGITSLESLAAIEPKELAIIIKPSGFYNTKAKRLSELARAALESFNDLASFKAQVSRSWLLEQKGIACESADSMLLYFCNQPAMIVDAATLKILNELGFCFEDYDEAASWLRGGFDKSTYELLGAQDELEFYKRAHAVFLNFSKEHFSGKRPSECALAVFERLKQL